MEGFLFYWIFWGAWIVTTFFYPKDHPDRLMASAWLLGAISLSTVSFPFMNTELSGSGLFIMLSVYLYASRLRTKKLLYFMVTSFIVMLANVCFLLFELFDPVWLLMKREWLLAFIMAYLSVMLHSDKRLRMLSMMLGMIQGEFLCSLILMVYTFNYPVAALSFLDVLALASALIMVWNSLELIAAIIDKHLHSEEKERERTT